VFDGDLKRRKVTQFPQIHLGYGDFIPLAGLVAAGSPEHANAPVCRDEFRACTACRTF
jgi:hypothetical protein